MAYHQGDWFINPFKESFDDLFSEKNNGLVKWFADSIDYWNSPRGQYQSRAILNKLTFGMIEMDEKMRQMDDGLKRYGLTWDDVMNNFPSNTLAWGSTGVAFSGGLNFVSSNINRLYR